MTLKQWLRFLKAYKYITNLLCFYQAHKGLSQAHFLCLQLAVTAPASKFKEFFIHAPTM
jgi:hypothetical protein